MTKGPEFDLFLSYSRRYGDWARTLRANLRRCSSKVFFDEDHVEGDIEVPNRIKRAIDRSRTLLLLHSPEAAASPWVQFEVKEFTRRPGRQVVIAAIAEAPRSALVRQHDARTVSFLRTSDLGAKDYEARFRELARHLRIRATADAPLEIPRPLRETLTARTRSRALELLAPILAVPAVRKGLCYELGLDRTTLEGFPKGDSATPLLRANALLVGLSRSTGLSERRATERILKTVLRECELDTASRRLVQRLVGALTEHYAMAQNYEDLAIEVLDGRYHIRGPVGKSSAAIVFRATDEDLGRDVAIKVRRRETDVTKFEQDLADAVAVHHPVFVSIYDARLRSRERLYVMEYVDGENLETVRQHFGNLPPEAIAWMTHVVALGIAASHAQGFVLRKVTGEQILIDVDGVPHVLPFGMVRTDEPRSRGRKSGPRPATPSSNQRDLARVALQLLDPDAHAPALRRVLAKMAGAAKQRYVNLDRAVDALTRAATELGPHWQQIARRQWSRTIRSYQNNRALGADVARVALDSKQRLVSDRLPTFYRAFYEHFVATCSQGHLLERAFGPLPKGRSRTSSQWRSQFAKLNNALELLIELAINPSYVHEELEEARRRHDPRALGEALRPRSFADFVTSLVAAVRDAGSPDETIELDAPSTRRITRALEWFDGRRRTPARLSALDFEIGAWIDVLRNGIRMFMPAAAFDAFSRAHRGCGARPQASRPQASRSKQQREASTRS